MVAKGDVWVVSAAQWCRRRVWMDELLTHFVFSTWVTEIEYSLTSTTLSKTAENNWILSSSVFLALDTIFEDAEFFFFPSLSHSLHSLMGSSLQSGQSRALLHTLLISIHSPLRHLNFSGPLHWVTVERYKESYVYTRNTFQLNYTKSYQCIIAYQDITSFMPVFIQSPVFIPS